MTAFDIPDFPTVWDSTMRSALVACPRQLFWAYLKHLRKPGLSIHLHFGGCVATGIEMARKAFYRDGCSLDTAVCVGHSAIAEAWGDHDFDYEGLARQRIYKSPIAAHDALVLGVIHKIHSPVRMCNTVPWLGGWGPWHNKCVWF
jgi:hypothetical protein